MKLGLKEVLTLSSLVNALYMSCIRLREVLKYFALNRFQNCRRTKKVKNTLNS